MKEKNNIKDAFNKSLKGFLSMLPMLLAILLLLGIFDVYITKDILLSFFISNNFIDTITGTLLGGVLTGNPMISYILGGELTDAGVSLYAVTAFILSWVTIGLVQLPAEVEIFGLRFTFYRTLFTFITTILVSLCTVSTVNWILS
ncbi:putative permease [Arcobacter acticola]|jgi:uncharacterized membrane protein YraQ (UPF0718 family)|uniref:Putative permease n=1 Tax=Arcobacter acticola TaxID=1849015 RepID=A0A6M8EFY0_9BACT|nr:permease [Arcobacter acticola]QKE27528.1 putative permease [Arcobacter acticola]